VAVVALDENTHGEFRREVLDQLAPAPEEGRGVDSAGKAASAAVSPGRVALVARTQQSTAPCSW